MKTTLLLALLCICVSASQAQHLNTLEFATKPTSEIACCALTDYVLIAPNDSRKSAGMAVLLEWLVPTVGHAYAGNWKRGLLPNAVRVSGFFLLASGLMFDGDGSDVSSGAFEAGLILAAAGTVWAMVRAGNTARAYNEGRGFSMDVGVRQEGVSVGMAFVF